MLLLLSHSSSQTRGTAKRAPPLSTDQKPCFLYSDLIIIVRSDVISSLLFAKTIILNHNLARTAFCYLSKTSTSVILLFTSGHNNSQNYPPCCLPSPGPIIAQNIQQQVCHYFIYNESSANSM